ncbi:concanavalin A-like lectin/glucanase domain-containing protein [Choanephora cucurbitarum]|nr:concanavalin A-like lectin/glucanase domain-containing protein [Choanephora cucurbitarum]
MTLPSSLLARSLAPPKFPNYLKQTLYGKLVLEQYQYQQQKHEIKSTCSEKEQFETLDLRLPTFWNTKDKSRNIQIGMNGLDLSYIGPGKQETHAALARSNFPMKPQCGLFYFEMRVISKGDDGYIGIGFCAATNKLERLPGWDPDSWGYHGDDGHSFEGSGTGKNYGPCFTTGDVIGCGVNFADNSAFYTKNGKFLGYAFTQMDLKKDIYPAIGLRTPGEQVTANFGHEPFVFDIEQYIRDQQLRWVGDITRHSLQSCSKPTMDQLVLSYLIHHGYTSTAKALVQNTDHLFGDQLLFLTNSTHLSHEEREGKQQQQQRDMEERQQLPHQNRRRLSYAAITASSEDAMMVNTLKDGVNMWGKRPSISMESSNDKIDTDHSVQETAAQQLRDIMQYGQTLRDEYKHDTRERTKASLVEIFSLLAYPDPYCSPVAYLMNASRRDALATEVNAAILGKSR